MRIVLITQDDRFYLPDALDQLMRQLPSHSQIVASVVLGMSPFGRAASPLRRVLRTINVFGLKFFLRYGVLHSWAVVRRRSVLRVLERYSIPTIPVSSSINSTESLERIAAFAPDLIVSIAANQIFGHELIHLASKGTLNVHSALLPKYRGLMPSFWALRNNETETGVSVFSVNDGIDSGPILVQRRIPIASHSLEKLIKSTKRIAMEALVEAIDLVNQGHKADIPNPDSEATYYSFPTTADVVEFRRLGKRFY